MSVDAERVLTAVAGYTTATRRPTSADRANRMATIDVDYDPATYPSTLPRVRFDGERTVTRKRWPVAGAYHPMPGDRVLMVPQGSRSYLIVDQGVVPGGYRLLPGTLVFHAWRSTDQTISSQSSPVAADAIAWDDIILDRMGGWDAASPTRWAPPIGGWYQMAGGVGFDGSSSGEIRSIAWAVDGAVIAAGQGRPHASTALSTRAVSVEARTLPVALLADQYVELWPQQDTGSGLGLSVTSLRPYIAAVYQGPL